MIRLVLISVVIVVGTSGSDDKIRFLIVGDWGGLSFHPYTTPVQTSVADQMAYVASQEGVDFVAALGDNFYLYGVSNVDDERFQLTFENVYSDPALQIPWYVIAGNHDHYGNVSAQIAYSTKSNRWKFPDYYHSVSRTTTSGVKLDVFLLDTVQLCGNVYSVSEQPVGPADVASAEKQWSWLEDELKQSSANYILVGGHYPVYSISLHGPTNCLIDRLYPLMTKYNVTAYLAGHDHNLQHIQTRSADKRTFDHFVIGSGNFVDTDNWSHNDSLPQDATVLTFYADLMYFGGFGYFEMSSEHLILRFIDGVGNTRYQYEMFPRH